MGKSKARNFPIDPRQVYWKYYDQLNKFMNMYSQVVPHLGGPPLPFKQRKRRATGGGGGQPPRRPDPNVAPDIDQETDQGFRPRRQAQPVKTETKKKRKRDFDEEEKSGTWWKLGRNGFINIRRERRYGKGSKTIRIS